MIRAPRGRRPQADQYGAEEIAAAAAEADEFISFEDEDLDAYLTQAEAEKFADEQASKYPETLTEEQLDKLSWALVDFCDGLAKWARPEQSTMWPYEREFAHRMAYDLIGAKMSFLTGEWARQMGKTETLRTMIPGLAVLLPLLAVRINDRRLKRFEAGLWVGIYAPVSEQAVDGLFKKICESMSKPQAMAITTHPSIQSPWPVSPKKKLGRTAIAYIARTGSVVFASGAPKQKRIEGKTWHLIILDEAQDLDSFIVKKSILPMGSQTAATVVFTGVAGRFANVFHETKKANERSDLRLSNRKMRAHFKFDCRVGMKYSLWYRRYVAQMARTLGKDSPEFRMAYLLEWILDQGQAIEEDWLTRSSFSGFGITPRDPKNPTYAGIDVAAKHNSTVLCAGTIDMDGRLEREFGAQFAPHEAAPGDIRYPKRIYGWFEFRERDHVKLHGMLMARLMNYPNLKSVAMDATGLGYGLFSMMSHSLGRLGVKVIEGQFSNKPAYYDYFMTELIGGRIWLPGSESAKSSQMYRRFVEQMIGLQVSVDGRNRVTYAKPEDVPGSRDDYPDATCMFAWNEHELGNKRGSVEYSEENVFMANRERPAVSRERSPFLTGSSNYRSILSGIES